MAYLYSKGNRLFGDLEFEDDTNTQIDFEDDYIGLVAGGKTVFVASGSAVGIGTTAPEAYLDIKNTSDDGTTNRTMIRLHNYRADDANVNDWEMLFVHGKLNEKNHRELEYMKDLGITIKSIREIILDLKEPTTNLSTGGMGKHISDLITIYSDLE